jgi:hypothetical protein
MMRLKKWKMSVADIKEYSKVLIFVCAVVAQTSDANAQCKSISASELFNYVCDGRLTVELSSLPKWKKDIKEIVRADGYFYYEITYKQGASKFVYTDHKGSLRASGLVIEAEKLPAHLQCLATMSRSVLSVALGTHSGTTRPDLGQAFSRWRARPSDFEVVAIGEPVPDASVEYSSDARFKIMRVACTID